MLERLFGLNFDKIQVLVGYVSLLLGSYSDIISLKVNGIVEILWSFKEAIINLTDCECCYALLEFAF